MIRLLLADDEELLRGALCALLDLEDDLTARRAARYVDPEIAASALIRLDDRSAGLLRGRDGVRLPAARGLSGMSGP